MKTRNLILMSFLMIVFFSCQKDETTTTTDETALKSGAIVAGDITVESVLSEANYEAELFSQSERWLRALSKFKHGKKNLFEGKHSNRYADGTFPEVSIDTAAAGYPITILIDYGDSTVLHHGKTISGTVSIEITAAKNTDGAKRIITYNGCKIDSVTITGTEVELFNGDNATTRKNTVTTDVSFVLDNGTKLARKGTAVHDWLEGLATQQEHSDDKIQKTGSVSVRSSDGNEWAKTIKNPLIRLGDCRNYVQGTVEYILNSNVVAVLDYGTGACDTTALLTVGDKQVEISLAGKEAKSENGIPWKGKSKGGKGHK
jgi:hypothetical protein